MADQNIDERIAIMHARIKDLQDLYTLKVSKNNNSDEIIAIKEDLDFLSVAIDDILHEYKNLTSQDKSTYSVIKKFNEKLSFLEDSLDKIAWRLIAMKCKS